ncbi:hypothetical protein RvY_07483 [Ramazzottius varieornatus]|uniref:Tetratricopeptide SHNi-TPR domain-containing protein n=1 Tax=Ramazzottius varieornatus TaxID=947166 RepID=A0A1D1VBT2_RAMVA|nr:hypothetical protein RvY_07483 [Ramazzottius varieornatus]
MDSIPEPETMPQPSTESTEFTGKTTEVSHTEQDGEKAFSSMPGTSGSSNSINWDRVNTAKMLLKMAMGKLKDNPADYATAIDLLDDVCVTLKEELGDLHVDTVDAVYRYGTALLDAYQLGSGPLSDTAKKDLETVESGVEDSPAAVRSVASNISPVSVVEADSTNAASTSEKSSAELTDEANNADAEENPDSDESDSESSEDSDGDSLPGGELGDGSQIDTANGSATNGPQDGGTDGAESSSKSRRSTTRAEGDAIAELRYAWEILEIARVGYEKRMKEGATREEKLRLSDIHYKLSLCAAENGDQNLAILEAERSLNTCKEASTGPADRDLAEAYFNLGSVFSMYALLPDAAENMKQAVQILENCKVQANLDLASLRGTADPNEVQQAQITKLEAELKDLNELIPDLMTRVQDTYEDMRLGTDEAKRLLDAWLKGVSDKCHTDAGLPVREQAPINDINHLVRRVEQPKRALPPENSEATKRAKIAEPQLNDDGVTAKVADNV